MVCHTIALKSDTVVINQPTISFASFVDFSPSSVLLPDAVDTQRMRKIKLNEFKVQILNKNHS